MAAEISPGGYTNVVAFLATAGVVVPLFNRLRLSPILGFLGAGVALGPQGLGAFVPQYPWLDWITVSQPGQVSGLAEFGVVFLLFMIGLELSWERLRLMRSQVFGLGAAQTIGSAILIAGGGMLLGLQPGPAAVVGAALAMSSTAIGIPVLAEHGRLHAPAGRASFSVLLFQDLAVAPILVALALLAGPGGASDQHALAMFGVPRPHPGVALASSVVGLVAIVVLGRVLLRPLFRSAARAKNQEFFIAASLLVVVGSALIAQFLGLSMALGAFVAGILLAETEYRHQVEVLISPFKDLLLGLFFLSVGLGLNVALVLDRPAIIIALTVGLLALKAGLCLGLARLFGLKLRAAIETGLLLAVGGEFGFVIFGQAVEGGLMSSQLADMLMVVATLSMFATPALGALGARFAKGEHRVSDERLVAPPERQDGARPVLIIGYGRVGKLVGEMLTRHDLPWIAVDRNVRSVDEGRRAGATIFFGDASVPDFLNRCGLETATAVVLTTDEPEAAEAVTAAVRRLRPDVVLVARARDARHARRLYDLGATDAVPETIEASLQLSEAVLVDIGTPMGLVIASIHEKRDEIRKELSLPTPQVPARRALSMRRPRPS